MSSPVTLIEPIGKLSRSTIAAGFIPREAEDEIARLLYRPTIPADREIMILAGFDAYARLASFQRIAGEATDRCVITPQCWHRLLGGRVVAVQMAHNHPSGIARPSPADLQCTREAAQFLRLVGIDLTDHLIFVESGHFSFRNALLL
ncbi:MULTISPECIES: JAB domain-containing protein [unclassified Sphingopyxis]|uniref:JAB domain-containing protein n=1 Tax=unclassified Sphingopyxis TaxID=2614943 RepID=UPI0024AE7FC5|nr:MULTISPECIES: JAB domain-containing protein [unclassified Sphingopyxis]